jgi:outer membrane protein assembly factor BamE (lipoprotein component of BamABCDE complex)
MRNKKYLLLCTSALLAACTPTVVERGNMLEDYQLKEVVVGQNTRSDVIRILGSPTTQAPFDDNVWYYIGQETEKVGVLDPKITKERVIVLKFAADGTVESIREMPKGSGLDIPIAREKTKTHGNEVTVLQQFLGNLGKFNNTAKGDGPNAGAGRD